jgi:hypothetical protein
MLAVKPSIKVDEKLLKVKNCNEKEFYLMKNGS